jgi:hypothetical protein
MRSVLVPFVAAQNLVLIVFCFSSAVRDRLGRRPSGYGHTSRCARLFPPPSYQGYRIWASSWERNWLFQAARLILSRMLVL